MNILQNLNVFQQNKTNFFNKNIGLQSPLNNTLNKVANNTVEKQQKKSDQEFEVNRKKISIDTYSKTQTSEALEDLNPKVLEYYSASLKFLSNQSNDQEKALSSFKEQLISYDEKIQTYQDIANGNAKLPDGVTMDDINNLLTKTQQTREKYLDEGIKKINKWDLYKSDFFNHTANRVFGENKFTETSENWKIDPNASDIYAEIDKVMKSTRSVTQTLNKGISRIHDILEKIGYSDEKYKLHQSLCPQNTSQFHDTNTTADFELLLASIKNKTQFNVSKTSIKASLPR